MTVSFSRETKESLSTLPVRAAHCRAAELAAIVGGIGSFAVPARGVIFLVLQSENLTAMRRAEYLLRAVGGASPELSVTSCREWKSHLFTLILREQEAVRRILKELHFLTDKGVLRDADLPLSPQLLQRDCCRRAFLRGAFLTSGSISNPDRQYHIEWNCGSRARAEQLAEALGALEVRAKISERRSGIAVYVKEADALADCLSLMGAFKSRLALEDIRILRGIQGSVNRQVNCETANLGKTVTAGSEQIEAICRLRDTVGLDSLPEGLRETALLRLSHPEASLQELCAMSDPPLGRSCVNHRLRKLKMMAEEL